MPTLSSQSAIIVTHSTRVFGPPYALAGYLRKLHYNLIFIDHPLDYEPDRRTRLELWQGQKKIFEREYPNWLSAPAINYAKDFFLTVYLLLRYGRGHYRYFIGCDSLSCLSGVIVRPFLAFQEVIAYNTDYSIARFRSGFLNWIYRWADRFTTKRADIIWCVTNRIAAVRRKQTEARIIVVPNGVHLQKISSRGHYNQGLIFTGNLTPEKGLDSIVTALSKTAAVKLTVYGEGPERARLEILAKKHNVSDRLTFAGQKSNETILALLSQYQAGVALYQDSQSYVYYSDPLKVKEYLAAGLPVIISNIPEIAETIKREKAGIVINSTDELAAAMTTILSKGAAMRQQARRLAEEFDWDKIYAKAFKLKDK